MSEPGDDLATFDPEQYSNDRVTVSGQPERGNLVRVEYDSNAGGAFGSRGTTTIQGEFLFVSSSYGDSITVVLMDSDGSRAVSVDLDADSVSGHTVRSLKARKTKRGRRIGKAVSVEFTDERINQRSPVMRALRSVRGGDTLMVNGSEYGVINTYTYGPVKRPSGFGAVLTEPDGQEYELDAYSDYRGVRFRERFDHDQDLDVDPESVQPGRLADRWDDFDDELDTEDTTDAFPAPHGATEGDRITFTLTPEDGEDERVSGVVTDVIRFHTETSSTRQDKKPSTRVELDDGREVKLQNVSRGATTVTRSRWEKMTPEYRHIRAFVVTHGEDGDTYDHVEAEDVSVEGAEDGEGDDQDGEPIADGGEWSPEPAELREGETPDMVAHARRNLEMKIQARREQAGEGATDAEVRKAVRDRERELGIRTVSDGGVDLQTLARQTRDALAESAVPMSRVSININPENGGDVTVSANGPMSREDWNDLAAMITTTLTDRGFQVNSEDAWSFVEVVGRDVETDGGVVADGGSGDPTGGDGEYQDPHQDVKVRLAGVDVVMMSGTRGEDGQYLAVWRDADASEDDLDDYHLLMELAGYTDLDAASVLDGDVGGVTGDGVALDAWKQKGDGGGSEPLTDGGTVVESWVHGLTRAVSRALDGHSVELAPRGEHIRVTYNGPREPVRNSLTAARLSCGGGYHIATGPDAEDHRGVIHVTGFQDGGEGR